MVLYKRKPVLPSQPPKHLDNNTEIWVMPKTGEIFTDYDSYLKRHDFLSQKKFTDSINGKSGLTYFKALDSENSSSLDIEKIFPDALKDPILRKVQFSCISRIDELVSMVFDEFRNDFFPGEEVNVVLESGDQYDGIIREKAKFPELRSPTGGIQRAAFSRYFVKINNIHGDEALLDDKHIKRDRRVFTKQNLRSFLKNSLQRDHWAGAPWLVKEPIARQYRLPMEIPAHLVQGAGRAMQLPPNPSNRQQPGASVFNKVNGRKGKNLTVGDFEQENHLQVVHTFAPETQYPYLLTPKQPPDTPPVNGNNHQHSAYQPTSAKIDLPKPVPPPIKYPIEDLEIVPKRNGNTRPRLKFMTSENPGDGEIRMESVGAVLEVWNTLNVHCEIFVIDSFTLDDFIEAMKFSSEEVTCELLEEIHCAVLKHIVNAEGQLQVSLPDMAEDDESDEEVEDSEPVTPLIDAPARSTRSRLSQVENIDTSDRPTPQDHRHRPHRAQEMLAEYAWVERLQARDFINGGWQTILVGLLYQLSLNPRQKQECDTILAELSPLDEEPTPSTAEQRYLTMDVNLRIKALQMITSLAVSTKALRDYLEVLSEEQTRIRKEKLDYQKSRKEVYVQQKIRDMELKLILTLDSAQQLAALELQRKMLLPDNMPDSPKEEVPDPMDISNIDETIDTVGTPMSEMDEDEPVTGRSLRRANERKRKRDEDTARREKEREEKVKLAKTSSKQSKEFLKVLSDIDKGKTKIMDLEAGIATCDADLREASCQRTIALGRDRFWNRYYWFERNGMPFAGLPSSSTYDYGYANARIWVQGPDELEREGFIDLPEEEQQAYSRLHGLSVPERKVQEEGSTRLLNANQWGFYDVPDDVDMLLGWLDERGVREKKFYKELVTWAPKIKEQMGKLKDSLDAEQAKKEDDDEPITRVSTRHKTYLNPETSQRCLKWTNSEATEQLGHLHSEPPKPTVKKSKKAQKEERIVVKGIAVKSSKPEKRQTRSAKA
ncbi:hypothetical protein MBLNU459_g3959t1 [Dothideomycetes sp. NU459]